MASLSINLLGPFQVRHDDQPVSAFESDKVRALLACLAVEKDRPHHREVIALFKALNDGEDLSTEG